MHSDIAIAGPALLRGVGVFTARRLGAVGGAFAAAFLIALLRSGFRRLVIRR
jgi:hypothetical protein